MPQIYSQTTNQNAWKPLFTTEIILKPYIALQFNLQTVLVNRVHAYNSLFIKKVKTNMARNFLCLIDISYAPNNLTSYT